MASDRQRTFTRRIATAAHLDGSAYTEVSDDDANTQSVIPIAAVAVVGGLLALPGYNRSLGLYVAPNPDTWLPIFVVAVLAGWAAGMVLAHFVRGARGIRAIVVVLTGRRLALLLPALLAGSFALACASDNEPPRAASFYAEITLDVEPSGDDPLARFRSAEGASVIRWWHATDPVRWRWEIETNGTIIDDGTILTISDGAADVWQYDGRMNTYRRDVFGVLPEGTALSPIFSAPVGPAGVESIDAFIDLWRERGGYPEVDLVGEETLLGRTTQIVELRHPSGGVIRVSIDPERMFIMRWAVDAEDGGQSYRAEVTALSYDAEIDASRFNFDPPPGAREIESSDAQSCSSHRSVGSMSFPADRGFLQPSYAPAGYRSTAAGAEGSLGGGCGSVAVWVLLESPEDAYILLRQRRRHGSIPAAVGSWQAVGSDLDDAYRHSENGVLSLLWRDGDVVALIESDSLSFEELLRVAESSELVPSPE